MYPHVIRLRGPWRYRTLPPPSPSSPPGDGRTNQGQQTGSMTMPGFWHRGGLAGYWGLVELRRPFHWVAQVAADETVWLVLDRVVGSAQVQLNGTTLGTHNCPWDEFRYEVTRLLAPDNVLTLLLNAPYTADLADRCGMLGASGDEPTGTHRHPIGGILGGVHLSVESRHFQGARARVATGWDGAHGLLAFEWEADRESLSPQAKLNLLLDDRPLAQTPIGESGKVTLRRDDLDAEPWWPRLLGSPILHDLVSTITAGSRELWHQRWRIGFRTFSVSKMGVLHCNGRPIEGAIGELWPDQSFSPALLQDVKGTIGKQSLRHGPILRVVGHLAPDSLYSLCDRSGMAVLQDSLPGLPESRIRELAAHPCFARLTSAEIGLRLPGSAPHDDRAAR